MRVALAWFAAVGFAVALQSRCVSGPDDDAAIQAAKRNAIAKLTEAKLFYGRELATLLKLQKEGAVSERLVDECRETIARIDHDQAILEKRTDDIHKNLKAIVAIRERKLANVARLTEQSMALPSEREDSERAAAYARFRLALIEDQPESAGRELQFIVDSAQKSLQRLESSKGQGGISEAEFDRAKSIVALYRYRLFRFEGKAEDALKSLQARVEFQSHIVDRYEKLLDKRMAANAETYFAKINLSQSRITLAVEEGNLEAVRKHLAARIETTEKLVQLFEAHGNGSERRRIVLFIAEIAWDKYLLAGAIDTEALTQLPFLDPPF